MNDESRVDDMGRGSSDYNGCVVRGRTIMDQMGMEHKGETWGGADCRETKLLNGGPDFRN